MLNKEEILEVIFEIFIASYTNLLRRDYGKSLESFKLSSFCKSFVIRVLGKIVLSRIRVRNVGELYIVDFVIAKYCQLQKTEFISNETSLADFAGKLRFETYICGATIQIVGFSMELIDSHKLGENNTIVFFFLIFRKSPFCFEVAFDLQKFF